MTNEKFEDEIKILEKFFKIYCDGKNHNHKLQNKHIEFNNKSYYYELTLCDECFSLFEYSINRLEKCPFDSKPRCRTCENPCYEPYQWKKVSKIMKYAGIKQGIGKVKKFFTGE